MARPVNARALLVSQARVKRREATRVLADLERAEPDLAEYRVAAGTGFGVRELRSLIRGSFDLDNETPTVTVAAACSKRRREDRQPIRRDLAERQHRLPRQQRARVWTHPPATRRHRGRRRGDPRA